MIGNCYQKSETITMIGSISRGDLFTWCREKMTVKLHSLALVINSKRLLICLGGYLFKSHVGSLIHTLYGSLFYLFKSFIPVNVFFSCCRHGKITIMMNIAKVLNDIIKTVLKKVLNVTLMFYLKVYSYQRNTLCFCFLV